VNKKKQKNFATKVRRVLTEDNAAPNLVNKSFLVLFFKKEHFRFPVISL